MNSTSTMTDEYEIINMLYFMKTAERMDTELLKDRVIVTKDKRGARVPI